MTNQFDTCGSSSCFILNKRKMATTKTDPWMLNTCLLYIATSYGPQMWKIVWSILLYSSKAYRRREKEDTERKKERKRDLISFKGVTKLRASSNGRTNGQTASHAASAVLVQFPISQSQFRDFLSLYLPLPSFFPIRGIYFWFCLLLSGTRVQTERSLVVSCIHAATIRNSCTSRSLL